MFGLVVENSTESHKPVEIGDLRLLTIREVERWEKGPERPIEAVRGDPSARKRLFHEPRRVG